MEQGTPCHFIPMAAVLFLVWALSLGKQGRLLLPGGPGQLPWIFLSKANLNLVFSSHPQSEQPGCKAAGEKTTITKQDSSENNCPRQTRLLSPREHGCRPFSQRRWRACMVRCRRSEHLAGVTQLDAILAALGAKSKQDSSSAFFF